MPARRPSKGPGPPRPAATAAPRGASLFLNRELGLLAFQQRVLDEALDASNPLLERLKFLSILSSNLDEFFMVRVGGLKQQIHAGVLDVPPDGLTPAEQLTAIRGQVHELNEAAHQGFEAILLALAKEGVRILNESDLTPRQRTETERLFEHTIFPILTPLAFDPGRPFPHISNRSLNLAILVRDRLGRERFARLKIPSSLARLVPVSTGSPRGREHHFVWLEQVIAANLGSLFPGMDVLEAHVFHVTRDADLDVREIEADDLLETVEEGVRQRRFLGVVRLLVTPELPDGLRDLLIRNLEITAEDVFAVARPLVFTGLMEVHKVDRPDLKDPAFVPAVPAALRAGGNTSIFAALRRADVLLHHPYDSFGPVIDFVTQAARDERVLAIKQTLYRVGANSPVVEALLEASNHGKEVAALVELKARFDEESNIEWARALERQGVHAIYGLVGLKTHAKVALVVRREGGRIRRYVHMATGNYNALTALFYTDLGLLTADDEIGADASDLFNYLTGYSEKAVYRKLLVAPVNLRARLEEKIRREIEHARGGRPARLLFKMNALVDRRMIELLYEASGAGVTVDLLVRGICCLRPGIPGVSEHIRVVSVVGRFLEHSRVYYFLNDGAEELFVGSADLMPRNLDHRVEVLFPIERRSFVQRIRDEVLGLALRDNLKARELRPDGSYVRVRPGPDDPRVDSQAWLLASRIGRPIR